MTPEMQIRGVVGLREWVVQASNFDAPELRLDAIRQLRTMSLSQMDAQCLCDFLKDTVHPAERATAAQVLGFWQASLVYPEVKVALIRWAERETDPVALQAMVFALRGTEGVFECLLNSRDDVALEAVAGVPNDDAGKKALIKSLFACESGLVAQSMCLRMSYWDTIVPEVVAYLMTASFDEAIDWLGTRVQMAFSALPQVDLLDCLLDQSGKIQRDYNNIWPGLWRRERQKFLWDSFVRMIDQNGAGRDLVARVVERVAGDEDCASKYVRHLRSLLESFRPEACEAFWEASAELGRSADRACLGRLAEMLIAMARSHPDMRGPILDLLGQWEAVLPGVRLQAFHAGR